MTQLSSNYFVQLNAIDVNEHIEKKNNFSYLSWPYAVAKLREVDASATWEVKRFDGKPYLQTDLGYFVEVAVTVQGVTLSQIHPVLDELHIPIAAPTAFDINTSIQRCLVKAIALHGLGLSLYSGEDLPVKVTTVPNITEQQEASIKSLAIQQGADLEKLRTYFKVERLADIPAADYDRVIRSLQKTKKAA